MAEAPYRYVTGVASERSLGHRERRSASPPGALDVFKPDPAWWGVLEEGTWAVGAWCHGVREEPACTHFSGGTRPGLQSYPSPNAEHIFLLIFLKGRAGCRTARFSVHMSGVREVDVPAQPHPIVPAAARRPRDPAPAPVGTPGQSAFPGGGGGGNGSCQGCAGARSPPPTRPGSPESPLPDRPSGPWARGRLDGSPCRSAGCAPLHPGLRTSPPNLFSAVN